MMYLMWIAVCDNCGRKHDCLADPAFKLAVSEGSQSAFERTLEWAGWELGTQFYCPFCPAGKRKEVAA